MKTLKVEARIWNKPGEWFIRFRSKAGEWVECKRLETARQYAAAQGLDGIKVEFVG